MTASDDGLISVVCEDMQTTAGEDPGEEIARGRHTLSSGASDGDREGVLHPNPPCHAAKVNAAIMPGAQLACRRISHKRYWPERYCHTGRNSGYRLPER